jgi:hypothetical protein
VNEGTPAEAPGGIQRRWRDGVALGAYRRLHSGPSGVEELGLAFAAVHEGNLLAAVGQLVLRMDRLERLVQSCRASAGNELRGVAE